MGKYRLKGQITVLAAMILGLTAVLAVVCVKSAKINASMLQANEAVNLGLESVFSEYVRPLFDRYNVFGFQCGGKEDFKERLKEYMEYNVDSSKGILLGSNALIDLVQEDIEISDVKRLSDDDGRIFASQVTAYMNYRIPAEIVESWIPVVTNVSDNEAANDVYEEYVEVVGFAAEIDEKVLKIVQNINELHDNTIIAQLGRLDTELVLIHSVYYAPETMGIIKSNGFFSILQQIIEEMQDMKGKLNEIIKYISDIRQACKQLENKAQEGLKALNERRTRLSDELYAAYKEEYETLQNYEGEITLIDMDALIEAAEYNLNVMEEFSEITDLRGATLTIDNLYSVSSEIHNYQSCFEKSDFTMLKHNYTGQVYSSKNSLGVIKKIKKVISEGVMSLVLPDNAKVSEKQINYANLSSALVDMKAYAALAGLQEGSDITDDILYNEYIIDKFTSFTSKHSDGTCSLEYETEYILNGSRKDRENLRAVIEEMVLLRCGFNFAHLICNQEKKLQAYVMSASILGFTGNEGIVRFGQCLLLYAWSYGEGANDVKILLNGGKISVAKTDSSWRMSLENIISLDIIGGDGDKTGLDYNGYMRLLLFLCGREKKYYRTMDVIEIGMEDAGYEGFRISELYTYVSGSVEFYAGGIPYIQEFQYGY